MFPRLPIALALLPLAALAGDVEPNPGRAEAQPPGWPAIGGVALEDWPQRLAGSIDPRVLMAAGLLEAMRPAGQPARFWEVALQIDPGDPVLLSAIANDCLKRGDALVCRDIGAVLAALAAAAPDNAETWALHSIHALGEGRLEAAVEHLQRAGAGAYYDSYFREYLSAFAAAQASVAGLNGGAEAWVSAVGLVATLPPIAARVPRPCQSGIDADADGQRNTAWHVACLRLGRVMSASRLTMLDWAFGLVLEKRALEALHAGEGQQADWSRREQAFRDFQRQMQEVHAFDLESSCLNAAFDRYMRDWLAVGEIEAARRRLDAIHAGQEPAEACANVAQIY